MPNSSDLDSLYQSLVQALEARADTGRAAREQFYHTYAGYVSYGLMAPALAEVLGQFKPAFKALALPDRLLLAERLLASGNEEQAQSGIHILAMSARQLGPEHFDYLDRVVDSFRSWSATDSFCTGVLRYVLFQHRAELLELLEAWSQSSNRWKRRASVVAFVRQVGESSQFTEDCLKRCEALLWDPDDLVQKGVGWALKDCMRGDKARVLDYVKDLRRRGVPATITLYAIRDLKGEERQEVLKIRKAK